MRNRPERDRFARSAGPVRITPVAVARPVDVDDLVLLVSWARSEGVSLIPRGAGTGMPAGNVGHGVVVDLTSWDALTVVDTDPMVVRCGPGVIGATADEAGRAQGNIFPALPSSADRCTIGGMVANNAAGPRSFRRGATRAWVEAVDIVLADGEPKTLRRGEKAPAPFDALHSGLLDRLGAQPGEWPRLRKNSSGYALDRFLPSGDPLSLLVGSEGTLGILTGIEIRLQKDAVDRGLVVVPLPELELLPAVVGEADAIDAEACEFFGASFIELARLAEDARLGDLVRDAEAVALVEMSGDPAHVRDGAAALHALAARLGVPTLEPRTTEEREALWSVRHAASPVIASRAEEGLVSMQFIEDSVVPLDRFIDYLRSLEVILAEERTKAVIFGHAGDANAHVNPLVDVRAPDWRERVRRILEATATLVAELGGTLSGEHGDGRIRAPFLDRVWKPPLAEAFREVKRTLDPTGLFNPGVIVPLPGQDPLDGLGPWRREAP
ncbi:MAG: FAD-binding oxidoreductase [Gemmatimonadetes bacterium]|nr:FAD-binding oxidoreductase [Gemmatimonadota bacterium]